MPAKTDGALYDELRRGWSIGRYDRAVDQVDGEAPALAWSVARLGCPVIYVGEWMGQDDHQLAVGPEYARAFLHVMWPGSVGIEPRTDLEKPYIKTLERDIRGAESTAQRDALTFGMFSAIDDNPNLKEELIEYSKCIKEALP